MKRVSVFHFPANGKRKKPGMNRAFVDQSEPIMIG